MNGQETRVLWDLGRDAWNDWAAQILKSKEAFLESGTLALNWFGEGENDQTKLWLKVASADFSNENFEDEVDLEGYIFPGPVNFNGAIFVRSVSFAGAEFMLPAKFIHTHFHGDVTFSGAKFKGQAIFDDAAFHGAVSFEQAEFLKERNGPLTHGAKFQRARFGEKADFRSANFVGSSDFTKAQFIAAARLDNARFTGDAVFEGAIFSAQSSFHACQFFGKTSFQEAQFTGEARFSEASFKGPFTLDRSQFWKDATFRDAAFEDEASFSDMRCAGSFRARGVKFAKLARFHLARFSGEIDMSSAAFGGPVDFTESAFEQNANFGAAHFMAGADFSAAHFSKNANYRGALFDEKAVFSEALCQGPISFANSVFRAQADFSALQSQVAFVLADARFHHVPSFLDASFNEPPRVDNMIVHDPLKRLHRWNEAQVKDPRPAAFRLMKVCIDRDASAKFRRLKKLAVEAQDQTRELEFFAQELRCRRFWNDRPFGRGVGRFWLGWFYGGVANYGRSFLRPATGWLFSIVVFALFYLSQRPSHGTAVDNAAQQLGFFGRMFHESSTCVASQSNAIGEALYLSLRNSLLRLDWSDLPNARRTLGCLYGLETGGLPISPLSVSIMSLVQMVFSAAMIFLFLFALRNVLKVR